ncbi:MAG: TetR/AcrR family transcriptional regulator, partial [Solirubrobacterales bacterium]
MVDIGVKRTTFSEVARRAGVSRMTLYRHFDDLRALLSALMTREFARVVTEAQREAAGRVTSDARAALVEAAVNGARAMSREPLFDRILELDPELLVPYMVERVGESQRAIRAMLAD